MGTANPGLKILQSPVVLRVEETAMAIRRRPSPVAHPLYSCPLPPCPLHRLVAVQEVRENFADLDDVARILGGGWRLVMSDTAGNDERMAFLYDSKKVRLLEEIGEIAIPPKDLKRIALPGNTARFEGFDRNPFLATFQIGETSLTFVNVHLYYGSDTAKDMARRALETFAVARWAHQRRKSTFSFTREVVALGDFNMPKAEPGDPVFAALTSRGLELPAHSSEVGSNLASDKHYDQIAFFPGATRDCFTQLGVFDFDAVVFKSLWDDRRARRRTSPRTSATTSPITGRCGWSWGCSWCAAKPHATGVEAPAILAPCHMWLTSFERKHAARPAHCRSSIASSSPLNWGTLTQPCLLRRKD